jgi:hypothetical protein
MDRDAIIAALVAEGYAPDAASVEDQLKHDGYDNEDLALLWELGGDQ